MEFPIRINKYLEEKGIATRRGADDLIKKGLVMINGKPAVIGYKVQEKDKVELVGDKEGDKNFIYLAYNKPRGLATEDIKINNLPGDLSASGRVFPLGRLDKESEGLILLTNDGRVTDRLLNPKYEHEKEYEVEVKEKVSPMHKKILEGGIKYREDSAPRGHAASGALRGKTVTLRAKEVEITSPNSMTIILTEGKKHQIRRMLAGAHLTVKSLKRVRIMHIKLGNLRPGQSRLLKGGELSKFLAQIGL